MAYSLKDNKEINKRKINMYTYINEQNKGERFDSVKRKLSPL